MPPSPVLLSSSPILSFLTGSVWPWALVVLGIGLVIFVHELGHFWAAKLCKVRVETFSLGFGPRLLGFFSGGTDYRLSAIPLGGYVKMAGDTPGEDSASDPDALPQKSVGQRMFIYVAGVVMNMIFALVVFPIAFSAGVPFDAPIVGAVEPGTPAWKAGLEPGDEILGIGGHEIYGFANILTEVALGDPSGMTFEIRRAGEDSVSSVELIPRWSEAAGRYIAGILPSATNEIVVSKGGPAYSAGLRDGDRIVDVDGTPITDGRDLLDVTEDRKSLTIVVDRAGERVRADVDLTEHERTGPKIIGIRNVDNLVGGLRGDALDSGLFEGDQITAVNGRRVLSAKEWREWLSSGQGEIRVLVDREGRTEEIACPESVRDALTYDVALVPCSDSTVVIVTPDSAAARAGLVDGARIVRVGGSDVQTFAEIRDTIQKADGAAVELVFVTPDGKTETVRLAAEPTLAGFGIAGVKAIAIRQFDLVGAMRAGWRSSLYWTKSTYLTLKKMILGEVGTKNLGGIISIGYASRSFAELGLAKLFFFLAILSINLAFVNLLPIPILDGGHLLFLVVEKIKGSPVNERVMGYSQVVGLVMILALLLYVTYNDIVRLLVIGL